MGLQAFKAQAASMTKPQLAVTPVLKLASGTLQHIPHAADPVRAGKAENKDSLTINPLNIDNSGRDVLRPRNYAYEMVDPYLTVDKKEALEREEYNGLTKQEATEREYAVTMHIYETSANSGPLIVTAPVGYSVGNTQVGRDGRKYTMVHDETGKIAYVDDGLSCTMYKGGLSASTPAMVNDDLIDDAQKQNIKYKVVFDKDGNASTVERTPEEADFQLAMARIDNQYTKLPFQLDMIERITADVAHQAANEAQFGSVAPSGISTNVAPAVPFSTAVAAIDGPSPSKSIMFANKAPAPWEKAPEPAAPAPAP